MHISPRLVSGTMTEFAVFPRRVKLSDDVRAFGATSLHGVRLSHPASAASAATTFTMVAVVPDGAVGRSSRRFCPARTRPFVGEADVRVSRTRIGLIGVSRSPSGSRAGGGVDGGVDGGVGGGASVVVGGFCGTIEPGVVVVGPVGSEVGISTLTA
jgi:hypothetical protein